MRLLGCNRRALSLIYNDFDGLRCALQIAHRAKTRKIRDLWSDLRGGIADEDRRLPMLVHKRNEPIVQGTIKMADSHIVLSARHALVCNGLANVFARRLEIGAVPHIEAFGPFEIQKVLQGLAIEWR
jgi:hypothetical protein